MMIATHNALSTALKEMIIVLINMSLALENNGDF